MRIQNIQEFISSYYPKILSVFFFVLLLGSYAYIFAVGPYAPGATLDPGCSPGATNCIVSTQAALVSGTNIKTINSNSLLGSGNISIASLIGYTPYNAGNPSGYMSSNQTITLSGDITGSGTTGITTTIGTGKVTNAMLAGAISDSNISSAATWNAKQNALTNPVTGTGASGQVAFWNGVSTQTSSSNLLWDESAHSLIVKNPTSIPTGAIRITGTDIQFDAGLNNNQGSLRYDTDAASLQIISCVTCSGRSFLYLDSIGRLGVGTTNPSHYLDVAGNIGLSSSGYINFNGSDGSSGYGIRDSSGTMQYKNSGGAWTSFSAGSGGGLPGGNAGSIQFNDGGSGFAGGADFEWSDYAPGILKIQNGGILIRDVSSNVSLGANTMSFVSGFTDTGNGSYVDVGSSRALVLGYAITGGNINVYDDNVIVIGRSFAGGSINSNNNNSFTMGTAVGTGSSLYGNANSITFGYVAGGGTLYTNSVNSLTFGTATDHGELYAGGENSFAFGTADGTGSKLYSGYNGLTFGTTYSGGKIFSTGDGSLVFGSAQNATTAEIKADAYSLAFGYVDGVNSKLHAAAQSSFVFGSGYDGGQIISQGEGGVAFGYTVDAGSTINSSQADLVFGYASGSGIISGPNVASLVYGQAINAGAIKSTGGSSTLIFGLADGTDSLIDTNYDASAAFGYVSSGAHILGNGNGSLAFGYGEAADSQIAVQNSGALTFGKVDTGATIFGQGAGSLTFGSAEGLGGNIYTSADGSFAFGYAKNTVVGGENYITTGNGSGKGSMAFGYTDKAIAVGHIEADGKASFAAGYVQTGDVIAQGDGSFVYGDNLIAQDVNQYIFGQNGSIGSGATNSFLIALGGGNKTEINNNLTFAVGADNVLAFQVDAGNQVSTVTGSTINPFIIKTTSANTCTFSTTTGLFSCASDIRLKHDINSLDDSALSKILALRPVTYRYNWQKDTEPMVSGFIAQELEQIFPDMVHTDPQTGYKNLSYGTLMPYVVKAVQEMDLRVQTLEENTKVFNDAGKSFFEKVLIKTEDGIAYVTGIVTNSLKIGSKEKPTGITLYDEVTGEPYCLSIANGQTKTGVGECGAVLTVPHLSDSVVPSSAPLPQPEPSIDTPVAVPVAENSPLVDVPILSATNPQESIQ